MTSALDAATRQLAAARQRGDAAVLADALLRQADALVRAGRIAEADAAVAEAGQLHQTRGAGFDEARCLCLGAQLQRLQGHFDEADRRAAAALALAAQAQETAETRAQVADIHTERGQIALARGAADAAVRAFDAAIDCGADTPACWRGLAKAHALAGRFAQAAADLDRAERRCQSVGDSAGALRAAIEAATAWQQARRFDQAGPIVERVHPIALAQADHEALAGLALLSTTQALETGDVAAARSHALAARQHALDSCAVAPYIGAAVALSRIDEQAGDRTGAYAALATGWATLADRVGPALARAPFEPLLRELRARWGVGAFDAARQSYEAARRARAQPAPGDHS
jgi:tetratricopeptide (TPR) repeat protein